MTTEITNPNGFRTKKNTIHNRKHVSTNFVNIRFLLERREKLYKKKEFN